jgi:LUC7 N_terminus
VDIFAKTLDQMMGKNRNATAKTDFGKEHFTSPEVIIDESKVCKHALVSFCPHELFPNTRFEMGHCSKRHDEFFKKQFFLLTDDDRLPYELKYIDETIGRL